MRVRLGGLQARGERHAVQVLQPRTRGLQERRALQVQPRARFAQRARQAVSTNLLTPPSLTNPRARAQGTQRLLVLAPRTLRIRYGQA